MNANAFRLGQGIPEFEQGDIGILRDQFFEKGPIWRKLAPPFRPSLGQRLGVSACSDRTQPTRSGRRR